MDTEKPVPIHLEFDVEHHKMLDTFVWKYVYNVAYYTHSHSVFLRTFRPSRHPRKLCSDSSRGLQPLR
jgi:hypothetical protein